MGIGGEAPYSFSAAGALPKGLTLSGSGLLSGTPTVDPGKYAINFNLADARGCQGSNQAFTLPQGFTLLLDVDPTNAFQLTTKSKPNGSIVVTNRVPGAGKLKALAVLTVAGKRLRRARSSTAGLRQLPRPPDA
jgi:hypothetical protein